MDKLLVENVRKAVNMWRWAGQRSTSTSTRGFPRRAQNVSPKYRHAIAKPGLSCSLSPASCLPSCWLLPSIGPLLPHFLCCPDAASFHADWASSQPSETSNHYSNLLAGSAVRGG